MGVAPYREEDLQRQFDLADEVYGAAGARLQEDVTNYVAGINTYIDEARINPLKMPGEYAAIGKPGPAGLEGHRRDRHRQPDRRDLRQGRRRRARLGAAAPGGAEALRKPARQARLGRLRSAEDPEAPETVLGKRFPYRAEPRRLRAGGVALPDRGTREADEGLQLGERRCADGGSGLLGASPRMSNALLVSARESETGRPIAVFGPQTGLLRAAAPARRGRARARDRRPRRDLRRHQPLRAARPRARLRLERHLGGPGHHRHVRGAALRAGRLEADRELDALPLPRPVPAHRRAREDEQLDAERRGRHAARLRTLHAERTNLGLVAARGAVRGKPVAFTKLRVTYNHEADSALGFVALNDPNTIKGAGRLQARRLEDRLHLQLVLHRPLAHRLLQLGQQPGARARTSTHFPVSSRFAWKSWDPNL